MAALIKSTIDLPIVRGGFPWEVRLSFTSDDGSTPFPASTTYYGSLRARSDSTELAQCAVSRVSDTDITVSMTVANIAALVAGLTFSAEGLLSVSDFLIEVIRSDPDPDETTSIILQHKVVK